MSPQYIEPFDWRTILIEYFLGTTELFMFAFIIIFAGVSAKFGMPNRVFLTLLVVSSLIFSFILGQAIYILIIIMVGYISFKSLAKLLV